MSSSLRAELQINDVTVRDFGNTDSQPQPAPCEHSDAKRNPSREGDQKGREEEEEKRKKTPNLSTASAVDKDPETAIRDRPVKLPYSRFYSPHWTAPNRPPQRPMPAAPLSTQVSAYHYSFPTLSSSSISASVRDRNGSEGSGTSFGSVYSTMSSYEQSQPHQRYQLDSVK